MASKVHLIFDFNSLYARSFFSAQKAPELGNKGYALRFFGSVLGMLNPATKKLPNQPTHLLFCVDGGAKRDKVRGEKPSGWEEGIDFCRQAVREIFGAAEVKVEAEADDAVATAAAKAKLDPEVEWIYAASGDKDLMQLAGGKVCYYCLNEKSLLSSRYICDKFKVKHPLQMAVALAILGDQVDAIRGVHKWGIKKVEKLFQPITPDMPLMAVAEQIASQVPDKFLQDFVESLELTLLRTDIPGVPEPAQIRMCGEQTLIDLGLPTLWPGVWHQH